MKAFIHFAKDKFDRVDVIFNNAGVMPLSPMNALKVEEWDNTIDVNIHGVLNGIAAGLPIMETQGGGQIVNAASIKAHVVVPTSAVYCATKYPIFMMVKASGIPLEKLFQIALKIHFNWCRSYQPSLS